jgi:hypothetical protein
VVGLTQVSIPLNPMVLHHRSCKTSIPIQVLPQSIMDFLCLQRQAGETRLLGRDCERRSKILHSNFHIQTRSNTDGSAQTESGGGDERGLEQGEETEVMTEPIVKVLLGTIKIEVEKKVSWWVEPYSTARRVWLGFYSGSISPCR